MRAREGSRRACESFGSVDRVLNGFTSSLLFEPCLKSNLRSLTLPSLQKTQVRLCVDHPSSDRKTVLLSFFGPRFHHPTIPPPTCARFRRSVPPCIIASPCLLSWQHMAPPPSPRPFLKWLTLQFYHVQLHMCAFSLPLLPLSLPPKSNLRSPFSSTSFISVPNKSRV